MRTVTTANELAEALSTASKDERGFVPTMGALHEGHASLVRKAREENGTVIVSIFVNPTQFNDPDDLNNYPRTPGTDLELLRSLGADIVFMPGYADVYPDEDTRVFDLGMTGKVMEGESRPGHFNGVAQVVSRLFDMVDPARAYFGEKDFQQVAVIKSLVERFNIGTEIVVCPTVREADGLAMSSRNMLLDTRHRAAAPKIYEALKKASRLAKDPKTAPDPRRMEEMITEIVNSDQLLEVIYFKVVNSRTLQPAVSWDEKPGIQGCIAVKAGNVRLIDNIRIK